MKVLVTRPQDQADGLVERLQQLDVEITAIPMLATVQSVTAASQEQLRDLAAGVLCADYAVFISSNAVRYTAHYLAEQALEWPKAVPCVAIGNATKRAVLASGWPLYSRDFGEQRSSEKLLEALLSLAPEATTAVIVSGSGGRKTLQHGLEQAGIEVHSIETYQRLRPDYPIGSLTGQLTEFLHNERTQHSVGQVHDKSVLIFASGETLDNFAYYAAKTGLPELLELPCLVPSPRVASLAASSGFSNVVVAEGASADAFALTLQSLAKSG